MRTILFSAVALASLLSAPPLHAAERLNVVFILVDDLGWADLGCYGSKYFKTPHIDKFATTGARFTDAYACTVCSPTRASLMTGQYSARLNITDWLPGTGDSLRHKLLRPTLAAELPANVPTLPGMLKAAGYTTGHIGKWHLGGKGAAPTDRGFDSNIAGDHTGTALSYFAPFKDKAGRYMPGLEKAPDGEYLTDRLTAEAEKFIEKNKDKPFFLYLSHYAPHTPMKAKAELIAKYKAGPPGQQGNPIYAAMLESMDDSVGRVLAKLDELKLTNHTLVIFMSDNGGLATVEGPNGPPTINAPLREGKGYLYEGGLRVPLIVRWPGVTIAGSTIKEPVSCIDFFPTLRDACGAKSDAKVDGMSLLPLLTGRAFHREALYWHYPHYHNYAGKPGGVIRAGDYKLIEFYENGRRELYNLRTDLGETHNLIESEPAVARKLAERLAIWRKQVGAKMMKPNPEYTPNKQALDGTISLLSRTAEVHGLQLRYEPLPHKNTLGYWTRAEDWASWEFTVTKPGTFTVEVLQGCGKGQGGSTVEVSVGEQKRTFVVEDTNGFQNFKAREVGTLTFDKPGRYTLALKPTKKAAAAVMDVRSITLKPAGK